jgi:hypothetical protein
MAGKGRVPKVATCRKAMQSRAIEDPTDNETGERPQGRKGSRDLEVPRRFWRRVETYPPLGIFAATRIRDISLIRVAHKNRRSGAQISTNTTRAVKTGLSMPRTSLSQDLAEETGSRGDGCRRSAFIPNRTRRIGFCLSEHWKWCVIH